MFARFAAQSHCSRGRRVAEKESEFRSVFQRDRDRIIHSSAFRRLKHKTQVFVEYQGDLFRTRLTHSIEVAQVARTISNALGLNYDLAEAVALAHDLGHTPFGHCGEDILNALMEPFGGFDHNAQALKIVTQLEQSYAEFDGLNLTWETLEAICKHNGPLPDNIPYAIAQYNEFYDLEVKTYASAEAQVASLADDIAYNCHDLHDGLRAQLFDDEEIKNLPIIREACLAVDKLYPNLELHRRRHEILRRVFGDLVSDVILTSRTLLEESGVNSAEHVRHYGSPVIAFSEGMQTNLAQIQAFLYSGMYRSPDIMKK